MTEHERIWLEPAGAPDHCWCQDNQWGEEGVEYVLASTLESLQRENEELREKAALHSADAKTAWAECDELRNLSGRLKLEAQTHAIEARCANSTVNEIYQIISGGKGEPGSWNGAEPVRAYVKLAKGEILRLETELALSKPAYSRRRLEARAEAAEAEVKRLRESHNRESAAYTHAQASFAEYFAKNYPGPDTIIYNPNWHAPKLFAAAVSAVHQALASTGGEDHGN